MKFNSITQTFTFVIILASCIVTAKPLDISKKSVYNLPSSPIIKSRTKQHVNVELLSCKDSAATYIKNKTSQKSGIYLNETHSESLEYLNDTIKTRYIKMRNEVISHVTKKVAIALFNFRVDGFAAENIATYVSDGTKPFLPFKFANGVKITDVTHKGNTIVYRTEMPITIDSNLASPLAFAGMVSAFSTVCNDMQMVDDLLGRDVLIQYDYYDANGVFFNSFTINA